MGKVIRFFNYEAALDHYEQVMERMRQCSTRGHDGVRIIAKPILILSVIKGMRDGVFTSNRFDFDQLNEIYEDLFRHYFVQGRQTHLTPLQYPFYYLQTDGFWHLSWKGHGSLTTASPTRLWMERNVDYAYLDEELWILLSNDAFASRLSRYVVENKIKQQLDDAGLAAEPSWREQFKTIVAALLMAI